MKRVMSVDEYERLVFEGDGNSGESPDREPPEPPVASLRIQLVLEDKSTRNYTAVGTFLSGGKQYMALSPDEGEPGAIHLMELREGANGQADLVPIEDEEAFRQAVQTFYQLLDDGRDGGQWTQNNPAIDQQIEVTESAAAENGEEMEDGGNDDRDNDNKEN